MREGNLFKGIAVEYGKGFVVFVHRKALEVRPSIHHVLCCERSRRVRLRSLFEQDDDPVAVRLKDIEEG